MLRSRFGALVLVGLMALGACAREENEPQAGSEETGAPEASAEVDVETVGLLAALAQVRGHHRAALEAYGEGDMETASVHANHPVEELLSLLQTELEEHAGGAEDLEAAMQSVVDAVESDAGVEETRAAVDEAAAATEEAGDELAGDDADSPALIGSVIASLLSTVAHEYDEAVGEDEISMLFEYQDGYAFNAEANDLYQRIRSDVEDVSTEEADEIEEAWAILDEALPTLEPPTEIAAAEDVGSAASLIGHELEETVGALPVEEADHEEVLAEIESLLSEIEETYPTDPDAAAELSAEAYLENYEVIEADVIEADEELNAELEPLLGAELRRQIQEGASEEEIAAMIDQARRLLVEVEEVLAGAH